MLLVRGARPLAGAATRLSPRGLSTTNKFVLTLNAGSSSIKFGVFDVAGGTPVERCSGIVEEVGSDHSRLKLVVDGEVKRDVADLHIKGHGEALANIRDALAPQLPGEIAAVGHREVARRRRSCQRGERVSQLERVGTFFLTTLGWWHRRAS